MKIKVNWTELGRMALEAAKTLLIAAIGGGVVSMASGCSSLTQTPRGQTTEVIAIGIPSIAWISHTSQEADHRGGDTNAVSQTTTSDVDVPVSASLTK